MKPLLLLFVATALIAQVPAQAPTAASTMDQLAFYKEVSDSFQTVFAQHPEAAAYFRGRSDAFEIAAELVGRLACDSAPTASADAER